MQETAWQITLAGVGLIAAVYLYVWLRSGAGEDFGAVKRRLYRIRPVWFLVLVLAGWSRRLMLDHALPRWWLRVALLPVALVIAWTWVNPRAFPKPASTDSWASRATFGERLWLDRDRVAVPRRHRVLPHVLNAVAATGGLLAIGGALATAPWPAVSGTSLMLLGKLWFCDRMVWLWEDMKDTDPRDGDRRA